MSRVGTGRLVTGKQAAKALGISVKRLKRLIVLGLVTTERVKGRRLVFIQARTTPFA